MKKSIAISLVILAGMLSGCVIDPFAESNSGTFSDSRDKHAYLWVRIGEQIWMAENLCWLPSVYPSGEGSETSPYYYVYAYQGNSVSEAKSKSQFATYGVLYNWQAAKTACPSGWHLPTDAEWTTLTDYLGGIDAAGKKMKTDSDWFANGNGDNSSGFKALPAGGRDHNYGFAALYYMGVFNSATENSATTAWYRGLMNTGDKVLRNSPPKSDGYSVRCLKD